MQSSVKSTHIDFGKNTDSISVQIYATNSRERLNFKCVVLPIVISNAFQMLQFVLNAYVIFSLISEKKFYKENNYYLFI